MPTLQRRIQNLVVRTLLNSRVIDGQRFLHRLKRSLGGGGARVVEYFHQVDDPYSHLSSQVLEKLMDRYDIHLKVHLVHPPNDENTPDRQRLAAYGRTDAARVAPYYSGVLFSNPGTQPSSDDCHISNQILAAHLDDHSFVKVAPRVGHALWDINKSLQSLADQLPRATPEETSKLLQEGTRRREALGHYNSAMFYFEGEWYWGLDRLSHLEERLLEDGASKPNESNSCSDTLIAPIRQLKDISTLAAIKNDKQITLEYYASVRSPYSCISIRRTLAMVQQFAPHVTLKLKPVLPMVMRGAKVPRSKRTYIVRDTHREAQRLGISFGNLYDPLGEPIQHFFSLYRAFGNTHGKELFTNFMEASFCRGIDTGTPQGLQQVVLESGLDWDQAQLELTKQHHTWEDIPKRNLQDMMNAGLWGVPSYRVVSSGQEDFCTWGQDRIWLVQDEIQKRIEA